MSMRIRIVTVCFTMVASVALLRADWTAVASTGVVDESDASKIALNSDGSAEIRSTISSTSAFIRYNVAADASLMPSPPNVDQGGLIFSMRYRDNGPGARVLAKLKRITLAGWNPNAPQEATVIATIDSDLGPAGDGWQTLWAQRASCCRSNEGLTFLDYGYVVEVNLIKNNATGTPGIMGVQLIRDEP